MDVKLKGGKTAPRLLVDLISYDPRNLPPTGFNILTDVLFHDEGQDVRSSPPTGKGSCRHQWAFKKNQSDIPDDDPKRPNLGAVWKFAAFCSFCGSHLEVQFGYPDAVEPFFPCPCEGFPLHHFLHQPTQSTSWQEKTRLYSEPGFAWVDRQCFLCTSSTCAAKLVILFKPPRLTKEWVAQLTDKTLIKARAEQAMKKDPKRFEGIAVPSSVNVLEYLLQYIKHAQLEPDPNRKIRSDNKKFATSFGDACSELLEYMGFVKDDEFWIPPRPSTKQQTPYTDPTRVLLDDVCEELHVLLLKEPSDLVRGTKVVFQPESVMPAMGEVLACRDYRTTPRSRHADLTVDEHPFYASLGALADFHDDLLAFAYDCQITNDPESVPYYLECLQVLAGGRESEELQTKAAIEQTRGRASFKDIRHAYFSLGLNAQDPDLSDDTIIGSFKARIVDAPKQETQLRNDLKIIGESRSSAKIGYVASQDVTTYEQAMHFLGADENTGDDFIPSMFSIKVAEKPSEETTARQAVILIANHRKSKALKNWLETGALGEVEMDVGQAYARLEISDRTVDDAAVLATYEVNVNEQPSQAEDLNRALTAIAKSRNSKTLRERLGLDFGDMDHKLSEWPVGIENIGNTCYLNSLLQFYFTIKPLRDLVLSVDDYKMPIDEQSLQAKRVGSRNVSKKEVERAQRFVDELKTLFNDLITSPKSSFKPSPDVARLTLLSSSKAEIARRQSLIAAERPSLDSGLGQINGISVQGPTGPPDSKAVFENDSVVQNASDHTGKGEVVEPNDATDRRSDTSSETLVDGQVDSADSMNVDAQAVGKQDSPADDKENLPPLISVMQERRTEDVATRPLPESPPMQFTEPAQDLEQSQPDSNLIDLTSEDDSKPNQIQGNPITSLQSPPKRPPPFPPRPLTQRQNSDAIKEAEYGAQQDVTEVIANVLFQLECAIKPQAIDQSGEQIDQIKTLFFGKQKSYITNKQGTIRTQEEYITDIKVNVASGPCDIYEALDGAFDVQDVEIGSGTEPQYATMSQLPPLLSILIQRAQFDPAKKTTFKSDNHLQLREVVYMDRYMDSSNAHIQERREQNWTWKRQLKALQERRHQLVESDMGMSMPEVLETTCEYLDQVTKIADGGLEVPDSLALKVDAAAKEARAELEALETQIKDLQTSISSQFSDLRSIPYRLAAVFIHVGSHNTGHYWIYIFDFKAKIWRKYNDEKITEVTDDKEIFEAPGTVRPPTPYYLVYVRDDLKDGLVDPLCRDVVDPPPEEHQDIPMEDYQEVPITVTSGMIADTYRSITTQHEQVAYDGQWNPPIELGEGYRDW